MLDVSKKLALLGVLMISVVISGCQSTPPKDAKPNVTFIDTQKFDSDLTASLESIKKPVEVTFFNPVSPNEIPPRMEKWLSLVEKSGGKINISTPANEPTPKNPALIFGLFSGLWNAIKMYRTETAGKSMEDAVKGRDANITLARNPQGNLFIQKIVFDERNLK